MIPTMAFGRTGHASSRVIFGAAAFSACSQHTADVTLDRILAAGVNHIDTAADYGDAEVRLAGFLARHRHEVFLATKTGERTAAGARASLERSLERMGVDRVDLIQLHNLVEPDEWETVHRPGGALEALVAARDEGLVDHIGVTGHGLRIAAMHLRSLDAFPYDSVLLPYSHVLTTLPDYRRDVEALLERCAADGVAVQTIKAIARRRWPDDAGPRYSWYEPLDDAGAIDRAVRYVLAHPRLFLNTSSDLRRLDAILTAAEGPGDPPDPDELAADRRIFAMTPLFDGAALERI